MSKFVSVRHSMHVLLLAAALSVAHPLPAFATESHQFKIESGDNTQAIQEFAVQSGIQIVASADALDGKTLKSVVGTLPIEDALNVMLQGTGLTHAYIANRAVALVNEGADTGRDDSARGRFRVAQADNTNTSSSSSRAEAGPVALEEVVVTANKVAEPLNKVPASIGVLTAAGLSAQHAVDLQDVVNRVPGMSSDFAGGPGVNQYTIRGISPGGGTESTVGIYIDDVSIDEGRSGFSGQYDPSFFDLDRIEVLRGPQGTLYGANSFAGTIRYVNKRPDLDALSGQMTANVYGQAHGDPSGSMTGAVNVPLVDNTLALRLAGIYQHDGGFIDHVDSAGRVTDDNSNTQRVAGGRATLLWQPLDNVKVTPTLQYETTKNADRWTYDPQLGLYQSGRLIDEPLHDRFLFSAVDVSADFGSSTLTSVSSYVDRRLNLIRDYTIYDTSSYAAPVVAAFYDPDNLKSSLEALSAIITPSFRTDQNQQWAQEVRLASHFGAIGLQTLVGLYYDHETRDHESHEVAAGFGAQTQALFGVSADQAFTAALGLPAGQAHLGDELFTELATEHLNRKAVFAEASWTPQYGAFDKLTLTAGTRLSRITYEETGYYDGDGLFAGFNRLDHRFDENQTAPKFRLSYQATDAALFYASASKGFRLGGSNYPLPSSCNAALQSSGITYTGEYSTDSIWSYEAGTKLQFARNAVQINASAFHIDWRNIAENFALSCGFGFIENAGQASSNGGDLSLNLHPVTGLGVELGVAYTDAQFDNTVAKLNIAEGSPVPFSPSWTASINVDYTRPISGGDGYIRANYNYTDTSRGGLIVSRGNFIRPAYSTVGASAGYRRGAWDFSVFAKNLTNEHPPLQEEIYDGFVNVSTLRPRQIGLTAGYSF